MKLKNVIKSQRTKDFLTKAYNYFCTPALIVHEFLHYLMIKLTLAKYGRLNVILADDYEQTGNLSVAIFYIPSNRIQTFLISMAPFLALLISPVLFLLGFKVFALVYLCYSILSIKVVLPSKDDFDAVKGDQEAFA